MMCAYSEDCLPYAQTNLAMMLDTAVYRMGYKPDVFYRMFLLSGVADAFGQGETRVLCGMSGAEIAVEVAERMGERVRVIPRDAASYARSREYWAGYALAYYQWKTGMTFFDIEEAVPITEVIGMYMPYHEMDLRQFADEMDRRIRQRLSGTRLAVRRQKARISQRELSEASGVPLRTIQQYEQRAKDINRAGADTLRALSRALYCGMEDLMEPAC